MSRPKKILLHVISFLIAAIRPLLGSRGVCIHPVSCTHYAKHMLNTKPLYKAIPLILIRLLSCNPITALYRRYRS